jgi:hypothetical protein
MPLGYDAGPVASLPRSVVAVCLGTALGAGCGVVDVGPDVLPEQGCTAPTAYFVTDVWPRYFARYGCGMSSCHDALSGRGFFRLQDVSRVSTPSAMAPLAAWPFEWQQNLRVVQQNISCSNPASSLVLTVPSGRSTPHPPGQTVTDVPDADMIFQTWLQ